MAVHLAPELDAAHGQSTAGIRWTRDEFFEAKNSEGIKRGLALTVGTPPQDLALAPALIINNTYLFNQTATCLNSHTTAKCIAEHGGGFDEMSSSSWSVLSSFVSPESEVSGLDSVWGTDTLSFGGHQNLTAYSLGIVQASGDKVLEPWDNVLGLGSNSTFLNTLSTLGLIASRTISIFSGMVGTNENMDGSLVIGGYDSAKFSGIGFSNPIQPQNTNPVSLFTNNCGTGLILSVQDISLNLPNGSTPSILGGNFSTGLSMCIDPEYPGITLPPNTGPIIQSMIGDPITHIGVDEAGEDNIGFYNSFIYPASDVYQGDLTFHFENGLQIAVTNDQLVVPAYTLSDNGVAQELNSTERKILINVLGWPILNVQPVLGTPFLSAAYLMVDYDNNNFTIANANITTVSNIVALSASSTCIPQAPASTSTTSTSPTLTPVPTQHTNPSSTSIAPGTTAGIVIACVAVLAMLSIALWIFLRRRRAKGTPIELPNTTYGTGDKKELPAPPHVHEIYNERGMYAELPPLPNHQMAQELPN